MPTTKIQSIRDHLESGIKPRDLTARQAEILTHLLQCWMSGFMPTIREIGSEFGITSPNGVVCHLRAIRAKGYLEDVETGGLMLADKSLELVL